MIDVASGKVPAHPLAAQLRSLSQVCAALVGAIGIAVLLGWSFDIPFLTQLSRDWVSMKANTALCFVLCSVALTASQEAFASSRLARRVAVAAAGSVCLIAALTLAEYALGRSLGIDQILFTEPAGTVGTFAPGRMALSTAIAFLVIGLSTIWLPRSSGPGLQLYEIGGAVVGSLAGQTLLGYLVGAEMSIGAGAYTRMAMHATLAFLCASTSLLAIRPNNGWAHILTDTGSAGKIARRLVPAVAAVPIAAGLLAFLGKEAQLYDATYGGTLWVVLVCVLLASVVTVLARRLGTATDAKVRVTEALAQSEEKLRATVTGIREAVITLDADHVVRLWNHGAEQLYGWSAPEAIGRSVREFMIFANASEGPTAAFGPLTADGRGEVEFDARHRSGRVVHVDMSVAPLRDGSGKVTGYVSVHRDVTERKDLQAKLAVAERMASIGMLAAGVAHEINNPLAYTLSNITFASEGLRTVLHDLGPAATQSAHVAEALAALVEAQEGGERVRVIVRDLKTFARGDDSLATRVDIHRVLESSLNLAANEVKHRAQVLRDFGAVPPVNASESRLAQVFLNLIVNAAQAIREGDAAANQIRVRTRVAPSGQVQVEISDTGSGMSPEVRARIFDPFFTTKAVGVGTGLGLSICHGIVSALGGEIQVESQLGVGTTMRVLLPAAEFSAASPVAAEPTLSASEGRVLIVDDEAFVAKSLARVVGKGPQVEILTSAREALDLLQTGQRFDVILCDLMMPTMTGMELHAAIQQLDPAQAGRLVFVTGGAFTQEAQAFLEKMADRRLDKPFDVKAVRGMMRTFLTPRTQSGDRRG